MEIKNIIVVGAGFMGSGIAQVSAQAGYKVYLYDIAPEMIEKGMAGIKKILTKNVDKGKLAQADMDATMGLIIPTTNLEDGKDCQLAIEAVYENFELKKDIFQKLDAICAPDTILATNTSSIPITKLAAAVKNPANFIGMHFFSPVPVMKLCEIIRGIKTSDETVKLTTEAADKMGKVTVVSKDVPGFIVNRINAAFRNEAYRCMEEGVATIEDIDKAIKAGLNHPMGPFELADFVGLDIGFNVAGVLYAGYKDARFAPNATLEKLNISGDLGRKTGKGWYDYTSGERKPRTDVKF